MSERAIVRPVRGLRFRCYAYPENPCTITAIRDGYVHYRTDGGYKAATLIEYFADIVQEVLPAPTPSAAVLRVGTYQHGKGGAYEGVLREGSKIIATCGHQHNNRDISTQTNGRSARHCIITLLASARDSVQADTEASAIRDAMNRYIHLNQVTAGTAARFREQAAEAAAQFLAKLPAIAALIKDRPVFGYKGTVDEVAVAPPMPAPVPCRHCQIPVQPTRYSGSHGWIDWRGQRDPYCRAPGRFSHEPATAQR